MMKRVIPLAACPLFLVACGTGNNEDEYRNFSAESEHWKAEMKLVIKGEDPVEEAANFSFIYTGDSEDTEQEVYYKHRPEWMYNEDTSGPDAYFGPTGEFLPDENDPFTDTAKNAGGHVQGGYYLEQHWITEVFWSENGEDVSEELIFEEVE
ncbi:hypothetical protein [Shouchella shacheensis]|uniref:hypothetical protein n=1 Tax=Shouchella shacheensis TaxID=1649580 RepID=UPI0007404049|nr:hypothetical protein [Shouchella shacheensis]